MSELVENGTCADLDVTTPNPIATSRAKNLPAIPTVDLAIASGNDLMDRARHEDARRWA